MSGQTENYIVLKPIAERFSRVASEITDDEIKYLIKDVLKERIAEAINFEPVTDLIDEYISEHSEEIAHAAMDSIRDRLGLKKEYKFW